MGFFSFIGKAIGGIAKTALGIVPGGSVVKGVLGVAANLLHAKQPMSTPGIKYGVASGYGTPTLRAQPRVPQISIYKKPNSIGYSPPPSILRASPVMPGGAIATSQGIMAPGGGLPPATYGGRKSSTGKRKRRSSSSRRSSRARSGRKRSTARRKLKFGSPAWRKKYMRKRR